MKKNTRPLSLTLLLSLLLSSVCLPVPVFALRAPQSKNSPVLAELQAGLEEFTSHAMNEEMVRKNTDRLRTIFQNIPSTNGTKPNWDMWPPQRRDPRFSFVALQNISVVGESNGRSEEGPAVGLVIGEQLPEFPGAVYVPWLGVYWDDREDWRHRKVATTLMNQVFSAARAAGLSRVIWHVNKDNVEARRFYDTLPGVYVAETVPTSSSEEKATLRYVALLGLTDKDPAVRRTTLSKIGFKRITEAANTLIPIAANDPELTVRQEAAKALIRMKRGSVPALIRVLDDSEEGIRWIAVHLLDRLGRDAEEAVPKLQKLSGQTEVSWQIRMVASSAAKSIEESIHPRPVSSDDSTKNNGNGKNEKILIPEIPGVLSSVLWAGDLEPAIQIIGGQPRPPEVNLDVWAPDATESEVLDSLQNLRLVLRVDDGLKEFPIGKAQIRFDERRFGPRGENLRLWVQLPQEAQKFLAQKGHVRFWFHFRFPEEERDRDTSELEGRGTGELIYHPDWLFRAGIYKINLKAWHSQELPAFEAVRRVLPWLKREGIQVILLHGIHPGNAVFEIDDYETADPAMGGDPALDRLLQEGKKMGFHFGIPWVPGHASARNRLIHEHPNRFYQLKRPDEFAESETTVVENFPERFLRGHVFEKADVHSAEVGEGGFGGNTVQANLWDLKEREEWAEYWVQVLGEWASRGVSFFYGDTGHSIDNVAPGWQEEVERRVRAANPGISFGYEAFWGKDGHFIGKGASFAQGKWLYLNLLDLVHGRMEPSAFAKKLEGSPPEMLQREVVYLQHYDGKVDPIALHVEWSKATAPEEEWKFNGVLAVLQMLGMPGIPMVEDGQESGDKQKWETNGWTYNDNERSEYHHPEAWAREPFNLFKDRSNPARNLRRLYFRLFRLRAANPAYQWAEGTRYPPASAHVFASYRSAGNRRALVILHMKRSVTDPSVHVPVVVELSKLGLSTEEMESIDRAMKKPRLSWPSPQVQPLAATLEQGLLKLNMAPFQAVVFEYEVPPAETAPMKATAGTEEAGFPVPVQTDRPATWEVWQDGGNVYPSSRSPLGTMAFVSPEDEKGSVGIYASLWNLNQMVPEVFQLPGIPPWGLVYLKDKRGIVPQGTFQRVKEILKEKGLEVVARISTNGSSWEAPMEPIDAGGGQIRFGGGVPAQAEFIGDYKVAVEVRWNNRWHRLKEEGWFRIHPLHSNGSKLRIPAGANKYKLWVSPTGQPVVIGWTPQQALASSAQQKVPIADQSYWIRLSGGRFYLLSRDQMERFGFSYLPNQPDVRPGERIVEAAIDVDPSGGIVTIPSSQVFEDRDGTLSARLKKSFQVLGIRWHREKLKPPPSAEADEQVQGMIRRLEAVRDGAALRDFLAQLGEIGWGQVVETLNGVVPEERDSFLRLMHRTFDRFAEEGPSAPVVRIKGQHPPRSFQTRGPPVLALSLNGVRDLTLRLREDQPGLPVEGNLFEGGGPLAVARAVANMRMGGEVSVVALGFGDSGDRLFNGMEEKGFHEESGDLELQPAQKEGVETRVSVNGSVTSSPTVSLDHIQQAVNIAVRKITAHGPGGTLVIGEHLVRVDDTENPYRVAEILAAAAREAKRLGWQTAVAASSSWDTKTFEKILETQPGTFHLDLEPFSRLVDSTEEDLLYRPKEEVAQLADQIRRRYGIGRFIVSLKAAGEILVTDSGWFSAIPSPALELTYVTGERDVVLGVFTSLLQMGVPPAQALDHAVVAGVLHMEGWGRPVTEEQIQANLHRAGVYELLRPKELLVAPAAETRRTGLTTGPAAIEPVLPSELAPHQKWKGPRRITVRPADEVPSNPNGIREVLKRLPRGEGPSSDLLIGPGALAGSDKVPALWPLLMELKNVLQDQEWRDIQRRAIIYTENPVLSKLLEEAGYEAPADLYRLKLLLQQRPYGDVVFYMGRQDWLLRDRIPGITRGVQLTPENYLSVLGGLLELLGYARPEPQQLEGLPEALAEAA